jgi:hypothetical protein
MFRDFSDVCRAVLIPPRNMQWARDAHKGMQSALAAAAACAPGAGELLPLPALRYRRVKTQGRGRVGDRSTVQAYPCC